MMEAREINKASIENNVKGPKKIKTKHLLISLLSMAPKKMKSVCQTGTTVSLSNRFTIHKIQNQTECL